MLHSIRILALGTLQGSDRVDHKCPVWMAPALQEISVIAMVGQYSRVSGLFAWQVPLALMSSASKVPIG